MQDADLIRFRVEIVYIFFLRSPGDFIVKPSLKSINLC